MKKQNILKLLSILALLVIMAGLLYSLERFTPRNVPPSSPAKQDAKFYGFIKEIIRNDGITYVKISLATFAMDGSGLNGYHIEDLKKEITLPVAKDATLTIQSDVLTVLNDLRIVSRREGTPPHFQILTTPFEKARTKADELDLDLVGYLNTGFHIHVTDGEVTKLIQQYVP